MISLKDIHKAMCRHIRDSTNKTILDADTPEPNVRPGFKIFMDTVNTGHYSSGLRQIRAYFNIYYYASDRGKNKGEIMEIEDIVSVSFLKPFEIKPECQVYIDEVQFEKLEEGILGISFNFEIGEVIPDRDDAEVMEELAIRENLKE